VTCQDWTSAQNQDDGTQGFVDQAASTWIGGTDDRCHKEKSLYCISQ
jgi:hypothetical protein